MEDYDKFVEFHLSQMMKNEEKNNNRHTFASSLIRFYGKPILPPVLSGKQREEMQRHRDEAQKAAEHTKSKDDPRMAAVQTILHSVQLRKMPTLEELLKESEIWSELSSCKSNSGSVLHSVFPKDSLVSSPPSDQKEMDSVSLPPLTSTTCSAFFTSHIKSHMSNCEGSLINQHDNQQGSLPSPLNDVSHKSVSSGYMTYENVKNTINVSGQIDTRSDSHDFVCTERSEDMEGFFLHNSSDTIAKMPDIISYPPVDGQELEKSRLELSICNHLRAGDIVEDVCGTFFQDNSVTCAHLPIEKSTTSLLDGAESKEDTVFSTVRDQDLDRNDSTVSSLKNSEVTDSLQVDNYTPTEVHIQPGEAKPADNPVDEADSKLSEVPYRLSLQALLKKSQEYRQRQRMLRIQAKNTKIQERTQAQPKGKVEEQSLSDKENDEYSNMGTVTAEQKKSKERCGTFIPTGVEMSLKKSWEKSQSEERLVKPCFTFESTEHFDIITSAEEETASRNNRLNASEFNDIDSFHQQEPTWTENTCLAPYFKVAGKYHTVPAPSFCRSPVHCKVKVSSKSAKGATDKTSKRELLISSKRNVDQKAKEGNNGQQSSPTPAPSTLNVVAESDVTGVLAKCSQYVDQLEFNLSGLKVQNSDLEMTLTENMVKNCSQTEISPQSDTSCESGQHVELGQNDSVHREDDDDDNDSSDKGHKDRESPSRQSLDSCKNICEEKSIYHTDELPVLEQDFQTKALSLRETRLVKALTTETEKESSTGTGLTKSCGQDGVYRKQQPPGKCILSTAQRMRIPDIFRTSPSETTAPRNLCVLSDTSNHLVQRNGVDVERHDFTHSSSLNQSYDVKTPSQLWLQEGSGSDSKSHLVPEKHLTPENGVEDQSGLSKVKRKLLMHVSEDIPERGGNISRMASPVPRPTSRTPKAAVWWREGHGSRREKQEQLKQVHAAQVRALQEEHRRQQEELLQALAVRYRLLQSVSFPCSMSTSHLGNTLTFPTISQASLSRSLSSVPDRYPPLLVAAMKGFLTRRLLKTERVAQLVRTFRDTWHFLHAFNRELCNRQDVLLQERVTLQLRAARYEVYDIFFSLSVGERMQLISWDRELTKERALKRQSGYAGQPRGKRCLSAATQKTLERKRKIMMQKKAAERHKGTATETST